MSFFVTVTLLFIAFIALAISGGFATDAARRVTTIPGYEANQDLKSAHTWLTISAIITWITVAIIIVLAILYIAFGAEETGGIFNNLVAYGFLFISLGAVGVIGVFSAIAAQDIHKSKVPDNKRSYENSIIAAVLAIVVFVMLLISLIIRFAYKPKKKEDDSTIGSLESALMGGDGFGGALGGEGGDIGGLLEGGVGSL